ncbi:AIM24 family protein [Nocardioides sp. TF02-7]|uniref:AIM24 family protein n=1 Tax=Nocardioides sp. TF02-7 TaxID=2917724 RepID=UPI001F06FA5B|nr:AIM24 family protein [Nocardioides sp. TF02-7]UMG93083.1 AIM24 family protein [Nocardioides sp. TF02-7]
MRSDLFAQETHEVDGPGNFVKQNSKMMKVELSQGTVKALQGSMVAYQGDVRFEHQSAGGVGKWIRQKVTGEGLPIMRISGSGEIFLAKMGMEVHVIELENDSISVNGANILAYSDTLQDDIQLVRGAGMLSGGLFNTTLTGTGQVALVTDGPPLLLQTGQAETYVDPDAAVCWSAGLQIQLKTDIGMKALVGRTSGEEFQLGFHGQGFVIVQPSENMRFGGAQDGGQQVQQQGALGGLGNLLR